MSTRRILLIEADEQYQRLLEEILAEHDTIVAGSASHAIDLAQDQVFDFVVCGDYLHDGRDGLRFLKEFDNLHPTTRKVLLVSSDGEVLLQPPRCDIDHVDRYEVVERLAALLAPEESI